MRAILSCLILLATAPAASSACVPSWASCDDDDGYATWRAKPLPSYDEERPRYGTIAPREYSPYIDSPYETPNMRAGRPLLDSPYELPDYRDGRKLKGSIFD